MKERDLESLGFEKEFTDDNSHYYVCDVSDCVTLITNECSDEVIDGEWSVSFFYSEKCVKYSTLEQVDNIIKAVRNVDKQ
jgi:hypothetical protein